MAWWGGLGRSRRPNRDGRAKSVAGELRSALRGDKVHAGLVPHARRAATRRPVVANGGCAGVASGCKSCTGGAHAVRTVAGAICTGRAAAIQRDAIHADLVPARCAAERFRRANRLGTGIACGPKRPTRAAFTVSATRAATKDIGEQCAGRVPVVGAAIRIHAAIECANLGRTSNASAALRHCSAGCAHAMRTAAVVHSAIAIVVSAVSANFIDRENRLRALDGAGGASKAAVGARSEFTLNLTHAPATGIAIVNNAIAVIIDAIAGFGCGHVRLRTNERTILTYVGAQGANALLARNHAHHARGAFVGCAIAIIVDAVTRLGGGHRRSSTRNGAIGTRRRALSTSSELARHTGLATTWIAFVGHAIAVVVFAVTRFRGRHRVGNTRQPAIGAIERSCGAYARHHRLA